MESAIERATAWVAANKCPLPLDISTELIAAGLDADQIETELLSRFSED